MATVTIGGKAFEVFHRKAAGAAARMKRIAFAEMASQEEGADPRLVWDRMAEIVRAYLVDETVTVEQLLNLLPGEPADVLDIIRSCIVASGGKVAPPGEDKGQ